MADNLKKQSFLEGPITIPLLKFTLPMTLAMVVQALYGAVDMMIVGHLGTTQDVSAVGIGTLIMQAITALVSGLSMGVTVRIGHSIGKRVPHRAALTVGGALLIILLLTGVLTFPMMACADAFVRWMATPPESFDIAVSYVRICSGGLFFVIAYNVISGIFRGLGDSKSPLLFVSIACGLNVLGDLYFVWILKMGAPGTAYATVIAQAISVAFSLIYIKRRGFPFRFRWKHCVYAAPQLKQILTVGIPVASQSLLNYVSFMILAAIVNGMGLLPSAAIAIEGKVFAFFILLPLSFMSAISAFVAQNIGAGQEDRARQALWRGFAMATFFGSISCALAFFFGETMAAIFEKNQEAIQATARLLKGGSLEYIFLSMTFCLIAYFNGRSQTVFPMIQGIACTFLVRLPLAYWLSEQDNTDLFWIGSALSFSAFIGFMICLVYFLLQKDRRSAGTGR